MKLSATPFLIFAILAINFGFARAQIEAVSSDEYLTYITAAAEDGWDDLEASRERWRENTNLDYVFGYSPPSNDLYLAALSANLFEITGEGKYLGRAKELLLYFGNYRDAYPPDFNLTKAEYRDRLPTIPNIFSFSKYVQAYEALTRNDRLTPEEDAVLVKALSESADFFVNFQEWGPMNRAMLRAEALTYVAKVLPDHPHQKIWKMAGEAIADDNWGKWEIEDATGYHSVWLYSLLGYASYVREDESLYKGPIMQYYFEYFMKLISPAGLIPDFGDAYLAGSWRMIPFFEKGAAVNQDPRLRWAAAQYYRKFLDPLPDKKNIFIGLTLSDAFLWADFDLSAEPPSSASEEILDDIVGKKIVFRDGWDSTSTYMLYNYRDEGDGGWLFREYLRTTIPVEEEKMHHGHSDENSIVMLMRNNSILLHDSGY
ncbi:MAG: hypothetical protein ACC655_08770, partial [Rhodothermia bacterium]